MTGFVTIFDRAMDDRGQRWKPCDIRTASKETGIPRYLLAPTHRRASMFRIALMTGSQFGICMTLYFLAQGWIMGGGIDWQTVWLAILLGPLCGLVFGVGFGFFMSGSIWKSTQDARDALLVYHLCPQCAHGIRGIPPEPDGCTVCPECGATWKTLAKTDQDD